MGATEALTRELQACRIIFWYLCPLSSTTYPRAYVRFLVRLRENYRLGRSGSMAKEELYADYVRALEPDPSKPSVVPTYFGKLVKKAFPAVRCNRKGPRGKAKQHYTHLQRVDHKREAQRNRYLSFVQHERPSDGDAKGFQRYISSELSYLNYLLKTQEQTDHEHIEERSPSSQASSSPKLSSDSTSLHTPTPQDEGEFESKDWDWVFVFDADRKQRATRENGQDQAHALEPVSPSTSTEERSARPKHHSSTELSLYAGGSSTPSPCLTSSQAYARTVPLRLEHERSPSWLQRGRYCVDDRHSTLRPMCTPDNNDNGDSCSSPDTSLAYPSSSWRSFGASLPSQLHVHATLSPGTAIHYPAAISHALLQRERPIGPVSWRESKLPELHSAPMAYGPQVPDRIYHPAPRSLTPPVRDYHNHLAIYSEALDSRVHLEPSVPHSALSGGGLDLRYPYSGSTFIPPGSKHAHILYL